MIRFFRNLGALFRRPRGPGIVQNENSNLVSQRNETRGSQPEEQRSEGGSKTRHCDIDEGTSSEGGGGGGGHGGGGRSGGGRGSSGSHSVSRGHGGNSRSTGRSAGHTRQNQSSVSSSYSTMSKSRGNRQTKGSTNKKSQKSLKSEKSKKSKKSTKSRKESSSSSLPCDCGASSKNSILSTNTSGSKTSTADSTTRTFSTSTRNSSNNSTMSSLGSKSESRSRRSTKKSNSRVDSEASRRQLRSVSRKSQKSSRQASVDSASTASTGRSRGRSNTRRENVNSRQNSTDSVVSTGRSRGRSQGRRTNVNAEASRRQSRSVSQSRDRRSSCNSTKSTNSKVANPKELEDVLSPTNRAGRLDRSNSAPLERTFQDRQSKSNGVWNETFPKGTLIMYTDGSYMKTTKVSGIGIFVGPGHELNRSHRIRGNIQDNNFAEFVAVKTALQNALNSGKYQDQKIVIRTDCLNVIAALQGTRTTKFEDVKNQVIALSEKFPKGVDFQHVYAHEGDPGNEIADQLAGLATSGYQRSSSQGFRRTRSASRERNRQRSKSNDAAMIRRGSHSIQGRL